MTESTDADLDAMWSECDMGPEQEVHRRFARAVLAKWGTPQPTHAQAGAVPLTDEQIDQAIAELGLNYLADAHATNRAVLRKLCHHAHDIKGGKHGTE